MIKHATASAFIFHHDSISGWRTGLVKHPIFGVWIQPGGHVESTENPEETVLREALEETGLTSLRLYDMHDTPLNDTGYTNVATPYWIVEHPIDSDNHLAEPHIHVDHKYIAIADSPQPAVTPGHPFAWFGFDEIADLATFDDVRASLAKLFPLIADRVAADGEDRSM